jgi:hypothetical protein
VLELLWLLLSDIPRWAHPRRDLVLANLLLRHRLALTRPTRIRTGMLGSAAWDRLLWVLARRVCFARREHLTIVRPNTVVRWHGQGWRLFWRL